MTKTDGTRRAPGAGRRRPVREVAPDDWSAAGMRARCERLAATIRARKLAPEEELADYWPGGAENTARGAAAWVVCYAQCVRMMGRAETRETTRADAAAADAVILESLAGVPVLVSIVAPTDAAAVEALSALHADQWARLRAAAPLAVYPKSFHALIWLSARAKRLDWLADRAAILAERAGREDLDLLARTSAEICYQHALCAWVACHPGPGLPFGDHEATPAIPEPFSALSPYDVARILEAHLAANWHRLQALDALVTGDTSGGGAARRPSWSGFFGAMAMESGASAESLMRDRSLAAVLASNALAADAHRQARDAADRDAKTRTR